ncbi:hypothetical protein [Vibrio harveyi]|uniref:hypothetical protein n=1 Tax=Vibrio harveyi TaxID=669 RepID=UPI003BB6692E
MKMTPHKILLALGFNVPEQGIEVNEHDAFFHAESLRLLGNTISIDRIDNSELVSLHDGMAGLVAAHRGEEAVQPMNVNVVGTWCESCARSVTLH